MGDIPESDVAKVSAPSPSPSPSPSSWLSVRVFYLRVSRCEVNEAMLDSLTVTHIPLTPDTVLELNGKQQQHPRASNGAHVSCSLRRDRVDKAAREATFVSTDTVRMAGSARFEVQCRGEKLLVGIMEMCDGDHAVDGFGGEGNNNKKKGWVMKCQVAMQRGSGFLKCGGDSDQVKSPAIEVYVASLFRGDPVVFTKAMQLRFRRKRQAKAFMEPIPECGELVVGDIKETPRNHDHEESEYRCYKPEPDSDDDDDISLYMRPAGLEGEDSELSWFTAGIRVGVGISLGVCLGVGIGAGLLARSYHSTSRSLKRRLIANLF